MDLIGKLYWFEVNYLIWFHFGALDNIYCFHPKTGWSMNTQAAALTCEHSSVEGSMWTEILLLIIQ